MTIRERIIEDVLTFVNTGRPAYVPLVERTRTKPVDMTTMTVPQRSIALYPRADVVLNDKFKFGAPLKQRELTLRFEIVSTGTDTTRPDEDAEQIYAWLVQKLGGKTDPVTGQSRYYELLESATEWPEMDQANHAFGVLVLDWKALYQTKTTDPEQWA